MNKMFVSLFSRTPVHVGAGNSVGAVDSPVQRERHTRIPIIPGSSLKGVFRDLWLNDYSCPEERKILFGEEGRKPDSLEEDKHADEKNDNSKGFAGSLLIGEAKVLAFPVRSAKGGFAWITCPLVLNRYKRDFDTDLNVPEIVEADQCIASAGLLINNSVVLEEYALKNDGISKPDPAITGELSNMSNDSVWQEALKDKLVILSDEMFSYFVEHACEVATHVRIDDRTGTAAAGSLFNQENVPSETLFYSVVMSKSNEDLKALGDKLDTCKWLQIGGNGTTGLGVCTVLTRI